MATARSTAEGPPPDGLAASLGLVLAGVALAAAFLPWTGEPPLVPVSAIEGSPVAAGLALVSTLTFALRRHRAIPRSVGAPVAGLTAAAVAAVAVVRLVEPALGAGSAPAVGRGLPIAGLAGLFAAGVAVADARATTDGALRGQLRAVALSLVIAFVGFAVSTIVAYTVTLPPLWYVTGMGRSQAFPLLTVGAGLGLLLFAVGYFRVRGLDRTYVDLAWPDLEDVVWSVAGLLVLLGTATGIAMVFSNLGLPTAESSIERIAAEGGDPWFLLALVPLSWLVIGPGEELVYRNIVQKYLYESFSRPTAVVVASVAFAAVHFQQYADPNPIATLSTLSLVFVLSVVLGYTYYRTENLLVPVFIHGTFNAVQFLVMYVELTGGSPSV
jgi:membrane protease YdiL (CAAX protease family)